MKTSLELDILVKILSIFRDEFHKEFSVQQILVLLEVARDEGITNPTLREKLDIPSATMSRITGLLGQQIVSYHGQRKLSGYNLIRTEPSLYEPRALSIYLTKKGRLLMDRIEQLLTSTRRGPAVQVSVQGDNSHAANPN